MDLWIVVNGDAHSLHDATEDAALTYRPACSTQRARCGGSGIQPPPPDDRGAAVMLAAA